jgi:predicted Fe-S protein YdhL (DUF1289 family)
MSALQRRPSAGVAIFETMQAAFPQTWRAILSPCVGTCSLDAAGLCLGCRRTSAEIAAWTLMDDEARLRVMQDLDSRDAGG